MHDGLYVRCLALEVAPQALVLCSLDLIGLFYDAVVRIREAVKARAPEGTHVVVASTHNHEGPDTLGLWGPTPFESGIDEQYLRRVGERTAQCALAAVGSMSAPAAGVSVRVSSAKLNWQAPTWAGEESG